MKLISLMNVGIYKPTTVKSEGENSFDNLSWWSSFDNNKTYELENKT